MKTVRVVAAVIRKEDDIFATARGYGEFKGQWEFPGGKIEERQKIKKAAHRLKTARRPAKIISSFRNDSVNRNQMKIQIQDHTGTVPGIRTPPEQKDGLQT